MKTIAIVAASAAGIVTMGVGVLSAAPKTDRAKPMNNLVIAISETFHLNTSEVQQVFDAQRAQMRQEMQAKHPGRHQGKRPFGPKVATPIVQ